MQEFMNKKQMKNCFFDSYPTKDKDCEFEDDGFLHIIRNGCRYAFFNGQFEEQKEVNSAPFLTEKHLPIAIEVVESGMLEDD